MTWMWASVNSLIAARTMLERFIWLNQQGWLNHVLDFDNNALAMNIAMLTEYGYVEKSMQLFQRYRYERVAVAWLQLVGRC